jgi:3-dehydroquinate dehydratase-2
MSEVLCLQGPNLNLLGGREPEVYGHESLAGIMARLDRVAGELDVQCTHVQSNHEGVLIDHLHQAAARGAVGCVINPAAYGHTSIALRDAFAATSLPFVEVHLSNVHRREVFRHTSLLAPVAAGVVVGFGPFGYELALRGLVDQVRGQE